MQTNKTITLDVQSRSYVIVNAKQGDSMSRTVTIYLTENGAEYTIPVGKVLSVFYAKPDGTKGYYTTLPDGSNAVENNGNHITLILAPQALTVSGRVKVHVEINEPDFSAVLNTFSFIVDVEKNDAYDVESEDYWNVPTFEQIKNAVERLDSSAVKFVCGETPDAEGDVQLSAEDIVADFSANDMLFHGTVQNALNEFSEIHDKLSKTAVKSVCEELPDESGNVDLRSFNITHQGNVHGVFVENVQESLHELEKSANSSVRSVCGKNPTNGDVQIYSEDILYQEVINGVRTFNIGEAVTEAAKSADASVKEINGKKPDEDGSVVIYSSDIEEQRTIDGVGVGNLYEALDAVQSALQKRAKTINGFAPDISGNVSVTLSSFSERLQEFVRLLDGWQNDVEYALPFVKLYDQNIGDEWLVAKLSLAENDTEPSLPSVKKVQEMVSGSSLPTPDASQAGAFLRVNVNGEYVLETLTNVAEEGA